MLSLIILVACGDKKQNIKQEKRTPREERVGVPKELESKFFDSYDELSDYLSAPIDSANRQALPERWFVLPERCKNKKTLVRLVDAYNAFGVFYEIGNIIGECMRFDIVLNERIERIDCNIVSDPKVVEWLEEVKLKAIEFSSDFEYYDEEKKFYESRWDINSKHFDLEDAFRSLRMETKQKLWEEYNVSTFTKLKVEEFEKRIEYVNFVAEYDSLEQFKASGDSLFLNDRIWDIAECSDINDK